MVLTLSGDAGDRQRPQVPGNVPGLIVPQPAGLPAQRVAS